MADHESGLEDAKVMEMSVSEQWVKVLVSPALWTLPPHPMSLHKKIPPLACASHQHRNRDSDTTKTEAGLVVPAQLSGHHALRTSWTRWNSSVTFHLLA